MTASTQLASTHLPTRIILAAVVAVAITVPLLLVATRPASDGALVREVEWSATLPASGQVADGAVVVTASPAGGTFPLATVPGTDLGSVGYAVTGRVRYEGVEGRAYLEMWSLFANGSRFFSRTLGTSGTTAALAGSSDWRAFELPFTLDGGPAPERLEINVVLPGAGSVSVGTLRVVRRDGMTQGAGQWIGLAGGIGGSVIGIIGAIIGWLVPRGRARPAVLATMTGLVGVGVLLLVTAVACAMSGQPALVVLTPLMLGVLVIAVFGGAMPGVRRAYAQAELRRMRAIDSRP